MQIKFVYKNKKTGKKVYSEKPLTDNDLILLTSYRDTKMKSAETVTK